MERKRITIVSRNGDPFDISVKLDGRLLDGVTKIEMVILPDRPAELQVHTLDNKIYTAAATQFGIEGLVDRETTSSHGDNDWTSLTPQERMATLLQKANARVGGHGHAA